MPGQPVTVNNLSQYFSLGNPFCSPIKNGPVDGVRTNKISPPLAFILSISAFTAVNMLSNASPVGGGPFIALPKEDHLIRTWFCKCVSITKRSCILFWRSYCVSPNSHGKGSGSSL